MRGLETWARYSTLDICNKIYCWWLTNRLEVSSQAKLKDLTIFMFRQPHLSLSLSPPTKLTCVNMTMEVIGRSDALRDAYLIACKILDFFYSS